METNNKADEITYKEVNGTSYRTETPDDLVTLLEALRLTKERIVLTYGDVETGKEWGSATPDRGFIGRSVGKYRVPLLVRTSRSVGGEAILDNCILKISKSQGGQVIYRRNGKVK